MIAILHLAKDLLIGGGMLIVAAVLVLIATIFADNSGGHGVMPTLSKDAEKILDDPRNEYVLCWVITCGIGRDFGYKLVYQKDFSAMIETGDPELNKVVLREIAEVERLSILGEGISPRQVIMKCGKTA